MTENEAVAVILPIEMLVELDAWIAKLDRPVSRAEAVRAFVLAGLHIMGDSTDART